MSDGACQRDCMFFMTQSKKSKLRRGFNNVIIKGAGVPWDQIMENDFQYLSDSGGHVGHLAEKFLKIYCSYPELSRLSCHNLPVVTKQWLAISVIISKRGL